MQGSNHRGADSSSCHILSFLLIWKIQGETTQIKGLVPSLKLKVFYYERNKAKTS